VAPDRLEAAFEDFGREVVVVNLAMGGYKQPQQLMTLVWALSLGAHFDVVLNLDGFNDIVLPAVNNLPDGVHPFFPRRWNQRVSSFSSPEETVLLAAIAETDARRSRLAASYSRWRGDRSVLVSLLWRSRDRMLERTAGEYARRLDAARPTGDARFLTHGPPFRADPETDVYDRLAGYWRSCSEQLDRLCQANGITYYHLLQPNQYVDGSKPLTEKELATAFTEDHFYRNAVRRGYPWLSRHGAELRRAGVRFADLTMVFAETRKTVYVDDCCHVNHRGYAIIARELRRMIRADQRERDR
jgi:hypothetical protein